jgi:hypothetical protein
MRKFEAFAFKSELSLDGIFDRLNQVGPWRWSQRDSDRYGDYLATRALPDYADPSYAFVRIFEPAGEGEYVFDIEYRSSEAGADADWKDLLARIEGQILPSIGARDVTPTENVS